MTAVEFIRQEFLEKITNENYKKSFDQIIEQAKEMEKEIIAQAFEDGDYNYFYNPENGKEFENGIEYYNKKFKSE